MSAVKDQKLNMVNGGIDISEFLSKPEPRFKVGDMVCYRNDRDINGRVVEVSWFEREYFYKFVNEDTHCKYEMPGYKLDWY